MTPSGASARSGAPDRAETVTRIPGPTPRSRIRGEGAPQPQRRARARGGRPVEDPDQMHLRPTTPTTCSTTCAPSARATGRPDTDLRVRRPVALHVVTNPESGLTTYPDYDAGGNLKRRVDARGVQTTYDYDYEIGRIRSRSYSGGTGVAPTDSVTYSYDQGDSHRPVDACRHQHVGDHLRELRRARASRGPQPAHQRSVLRHRVRVQPRGPAHGGDRGSLLLDLDPIRRCGPDCRRHRQQALAERHRSS